MLEVDPKLKVRLVDDFSRTLMDGAARAANDVESPVRGNVFASLAREVMTHTLHELAPDEDVTRCSWFKLEPNASKPTRAQRTRYIIQGGLTESFVHQDGSE